MDDYERSIVMRRRLTQKAWERGDAEAVAAYESAITRVNEAWRKEKGSHGTR